MIKSENNVEITDERQNIYEEDEDDWEDVGNESFVIDYSKI